MENNFKHTPGPWEIWSGTIVCDQEGNNICQFFNKNEYDFKNAENNIKLIAAAPELLEALQYAQAYLSKGGFGRKDCLDKVTETIKKATE